MNIYINKCQIPAQFPFFEGQAPPLANDVRSWLKTSTDLIGTSLALTLRTIKTQACFFAGTEWATEPKD